MSKTVRSIPDIPFRKSLKERSHRSYRRMCKQDTRNAVDFPDDYTPLMHGNKFSFGHMLGQPSDSSLNC